MRSRCRLLVALGLSAATFGGSRHAQAQDKYALAMFHFNVQYVAGGMVGYWAVPHPELDLSAEQIEDMIIVESFAPVLDLYARHPSWSVDLEMQGYMLDVIAERHPSLLVQLREMADSGQVDVISFHYSDQLFIGYPQQAWERSQDLTRATFEKHSVPLSSSVFCQEGQAGQALAGAMRSRGYRTMAWPKNLWTYQHGEFDAAPLYQFGDISMVVAGKGVSYDQGGNSIQMTWTFFDDGELLATGDMNPYFPDQFKVNDAAIAKYEQELVELEQQGFEITTIERYVQAVSGKVTPVEPPPLLDGTWQPNSTDGVHRWLGGKGLWADDERDNHIRTLGAMAQRELVAAETIAAQAGIDAQDALASAWRIMLLGQVTDATGINPFRGEIEYGFAHFTEALRIARDVIEQAKQALGMDAVSIDPASGTVAAAEPELVGTEIEPPLALIIKAGDREVDERWERLEPGHLRASITFGRGDAPLLSVEFPASLVDEFTVTRALEDSTPTIYKRSTFTFDYFYLALPTGLIELSPGRFIIKDQAHVHLAAQVFRERGGIVFSDETAPPQESVTWVFHLFDGTSQEAVNLANLLNAKRKVAR